MIIRIPVISNTIENTFLSFTASNLVESEAPTGANNTVNGTMHKNATRLTSPNVPTGASEGDCPKISIVAAPGKEIIKPIAAAVPTALCAG